MMMMILVKRRFHLMIINGDESSVTSVSLDGRKDESQFNVGFT